jgi:hypothetical protein
MDMTGEIRPFLFDLHHSQFPGLYLHSKLYFAENEGMWWRYFGSHNFSRSAWGWLNNTKTELKINNFELGVLFVQTKDSDAKKPIHERFPIPIDLDRARKYEATDEPWTDDNMKSKRRVKNEPWKRKKGKKGLEKINHWKKKKEKKVQPQ